MKWIMTAATIAALLVTTTAALAADWVLIDENDSSSFYYDRSELRKPEVGKVRVRAKAVYTPEGKAEALSVLSHYKNMDRLYESLYDYELDCIERESHLLDVSHLDKDAKVLRSSDLGGVTQWEDILPDTRIALVFDEVCPQ